MVRGGSGVVCLPLLKQCQGQSGMAVGVFLKLLINIGLRDISRRAGVAAVACRGRLPCIFCTARYFLHCKDAQWGLFCVYVDDAELGKCTVPVWGDGVKDEAEVALVAGFEGRSGDGTDVNVWVAHANQFEGLGLVLGDFAGDIAEEHLDTDAGDSAVARVGYVAIQIGDFAACQIAGLAHGEFGDGEAGCIGIWPGRDGGYLTGAFSVAKE